MGHRCKHKWVVNVWYRRGKKIGVIEGEGETGREASDSGDSLDNHSAVFTPGKYCFQVASSSC